MTWINPLDRLPQIPQDWANHICYGGALGVLVHLAVWSLTPWLLQVWRFIPVSPALMALLVVFTVSAAKKIVDYFKLRGTDREESVQMCVGKTFVTAAFPAAFLLLSKL